MLGATISSCEKQKELSDEGAAVLRGNVLPYLSICHQYGKAKVQPNCRRMLVIDKNLVPRAEAIR